MTSSDLDPSRAFRLATARPGRTVAFEDVRTRVLRRRPSQERRRRRGRAGRRSCAHRWPHARAPARRAGEGGSHAPPSAPRSASTPTPGTTGLSGVIAFRRVRKRGGQRQVCPP